MPTEEQYNRMAWYEKWVADWSSVKQQAWVAATEAFDAATFGPGELYQLVADYLATLKSVEEILHRTGAQIQESNAPLKAHIKWAELDKRYRDLYAPILVDSVPAPSVGNPVVIAVVVVSGLSLGAMACAYAVAHLADAAALWTEANAWAETELARNQLAADGKPVPASSTAPWERPPDDPDGDGFSKVITGLGLLIGLGIAANYVGGLK